MVKHATYSITGLPVETPSTGCVSISGTDELRDEEAGGEIEEGRAPGYRGAPFGPRGSTVSGQHSKLWYPRLYLVLLWSNPTSEPASVAPTP